MWGVQQSRQRSSSSLQMQQQAPETATEGPTKLSPKQERRRIIQSPNFHRQLGFSNGEKEGVESQMVSEFTGQLINEMKDRTFTHQKGDLTIKLAKSFGFCWGVERAVAMAYEARAHFPDRVSSAIMAWVGLVCLCHAAWRSISWSLFITTRNDRKSTSRTRSSTTRASTSGWPTWRSTSCPVRTQTHAVTTNRWLPPLPDRSFHAKQHHNKQSRTARRSSTTSGRTTW
jgi:hypothetical protein